MSVSSGSDVTIPIQDSPPPPPSPYGNRNLPGSKTKTPEPRGDIGSGVDNNAFQSTENQICSTSSSNGGKSLNETPKGKRSHTEITMNGNPDSSTVNEAVNPELINMNVLDTIPLKPQPEFGPYENFDEYFISVNQHKKFLRRGEKLYVTKDKRKTSKWKKYVCWVIGAFILATIVAVAVLAAAGVIPGKSPTSVSMAGTMTTTSSLDKTTTPSSQPEISTSTSERQQSSSFAPDESSVPPSSTTIQIPVSSNYVPSAIDVQLTLDNAEYDDDLADTTSTKFLEMASDLEQKIKKVFSDEGKLETVFARVTGFSRGSVVAKIRLGWIDESQRLADVQRFVSTLKTIGDYQVRQGTTTSYDLYNLCKVSNNDCSNYCTFDYESLDFLCTCPDHLLLAEDKKTCREISSPSPSSFPDVMSNVTDAETVPEPEIPTTLSPEIQDESTSHEPSVMPDQEPEISSTTSTTTTTTTTTPPPEIEPIDETSSKAPEPEIEIPVPSEEPTVIQPLPILPNNSQSTIPVILLDDDDVVTTMMPDHDYQVDLQPELTPDMVSPTNASTERSARIVVSEPSILEDVPEVPGNSSVAREPEIMTGPEEESVEDERPTGETPTDANEMTIHEIHHPVAPIVDEITTTSTTTPTPPVVEVVETNATSAEVTEDPQTVDGDVETISHTSSETNRTSRLILESPLSQVREHEEVESEETPSEEAQQDTSAQKSEDEEAGVVAPSGPAEEPEQPEMVSRNETENTETGPQVLTAIPVEEQPEISVVTTQEPESVKETVSENKNETDVQQETSGPDTVVLSSEEREREALAPATNDEPVVEVAEPKEAENGTIDTPEEENTPTADEKHEETLVILDTTPTSTTTQMTTTTLTPLKIEAEGGDEPKKSEESEVEKVVLPGSDEVEVSPTIIPQRPHITSDEFMAFSDANMSLVNAKLNLKKENASDPSSASVETGSYETVSGDDSELSSASASVENSHAKQSVPEVGHREIEEVTTIVPISLANDTAVNDLTENVTEDLVNTENIFPKTSEETILPPVTESSGSRETEHGVDDEKLTEEVNPILNITVTTTIKPEQELPEPNPIEESKPIAEKDLTVFSDAEKVPSSSSEVLETTPIPSSDSRIFSTTIPILPNLNDNEKESSEIISQTTPLSTSSTSTTTTGPIDTSDDSFISETHANNTAPQSSVDNENELQ